MLARRVGYRCSNPGCRKLTSGPQVDPTKALNIGVAAHIAAASPGGKRYDSTMSPKERKSINNGIWLCQNCAKLVDNDEQRYPTSLLLGWKSSAEQAALQEIENPVPRTGTPGTFDLPYPDTFFVGRTEELSLLSNLLEQARSIVVAGTGGIGKTQLIVQALHLRDDLPTIWIDVESYLRIEDLQLALSSALQEKGFTASSNLIQALYTTSIRIVFDGVEQATREGWDDIEDFFHLLLTRTRTPQFIFTSQVALDNLEPDYQLLLEPLQTEHAKEILQTRGILGKELNLAEENALTWLVDFAEGHTLTLRLIAAQLKRLREPVVVKKCIEQLGSSALDKPRRQKHTRLTSLNIALRLAYESLTSEQKTLLLYVSCLPGGCWHIWLERAPRSKNIKIDIAEICDWYLVDQNQDNLNQLRYKVLSPIRAFVQTIENSINPDAIIHVQNEISHQFMHHALMLHETYMQFGDVRWGIEVFEMDLPNFFAALEYGYKAQEHSKTERGEDWQESNQVVFGLASGLAIYFFVRGHFQRGITTLRKGIDAGRQLEDECGHLYRMLIVMYGRVFNQEGLSSVLSEFKVIAEHSSNPDLKANYAILQGEFAFVKRDYKLADSYYQQAEQHYTEALNEASALEDEIEKTEKERNITQLLAETLAHRARAREYMEDYHSGLVLGQKALNLLRLTGDKINPPSAVFHIGRCHLGLGNYKDAFLAFTSATLEFYSIGTRQYLGNSLAEIDELSTKENITLPDLSLPAEIIVDGLDDVTNEMRSVLSSLDNIKTPWGMEVLRKMFAIVALASYQSNPGFLLKWAINVKQNLINAAVDTRVISRNNISPAGVLIIELDFIAAVAYISTQLCLSGQLPEEGLQNLCMCCHKMVAFKWEISPFDWLSTWIKMHYPEQTSVTAAKSRAAAKRTFDQGQPFTIK
jgi:tetratricopeptide (TPR) repeat protein